MDNAIYVHVQPLPEQEENIAVVMEHVKRPARSMNAPVLNVSAILDGLGINAKKIKAIVGFIGDKCQNWSKFRY